MKENLSAVFILVREAEPDVIIGYYMLSQQVDAAELPDELKKQTGKYKRIGVTLLGRLAVTNEHKGKRLLMSKRLQVILKDPEYREIQRVARSRHMSLAEWVRQALDSARRQEPLGSLSKKLEVIRRAVEHDYPARDVDSMLAEIESGYGSGALS